MQFYTNIASLHLPLWWLLLLAIPHAGPLTRNYTHRAGVNAYPQRRTNAAQKYQKNQLILYDPTTGRQMQPFRQGFMRQTQKSVNGNVVDLQSLWPPCSCTDFLCMCCLGVQFGTILDQRICIALEYNSAQISIQMRINRNQQTIATFGFSARNPPAYCVPVIVALPVATCLRLYDVRATDGNVQVCLALVLNVMTNQLFDYRFDCVQFGGNGVQFVKPLLTELNLTSAEGQLEEGNDGQSQSIRVQLDEEVSGVSVQTDSDNPVGKRLKPTSEEESQ